MQLNNIFLKKKEKQLQTLSFSNNLKQFTTALFLKSPYI